MLKKGDGSGSIAASMNGATLTMLEQVAGPKRITVGGDKGYDVRGFVDAFRRLHLTPHVAQNIDRSGGSAIDARTTGPTGYLISQRKRKLVEGIFGWGKTVGNFRKTRFVGLAKNKLSSDAARDDLVPCTSRR